MTAHWEFAYGPAIFKQRASELGYPMLAINVCEKAAKERYFPRYSVKEIGGLRIGLVGIASNIVDKTMPASYSEGLYFTLGREELPGILDELRTREKVDLIVLSSHFGLLLDQDPCKSDVKVGHCLGDY